MDEDEWRPLAEYCLDNSKGILRSNQIAFLDDILNGWEGRLTDNQANWLNDLADRVDEVLKDIAKSDPSKHRGGAP